MTVHAHEIAAMRRAIELSALGLGSTSPNPPVGCVILDATGRFAGEGYHLRKGESHAEVHALVAAKRLASGGTALVTLEPCNHHGRTPACHQALIDAGIKRVLIGVIDPTSRGEGGAERLRQAGVDVDVGVLADEALVVLQPWLTALENRRPTVIWVCDNTSGEPRQLSEEMLAETGLRSQVDAVLLSDGHVVEGIPNAHGPSAFDLPPTTPVNAPKDALAMLYRAGARTVLLHGPTSLAEAFMRDALVDEIKTFIAAQRTTSTTTMNHANVLAGFKIRAVRRLGTGVLIAAKTCSAEGVVEVVGG